MKKIIALILALTICGAAFTACGDNSKTGTPDVGGAGNTSDSVTEQVERLTEITLPIAEEKMTFTKWRVWSSDYLTSYSEIGGVQELENRTNIHIDYTTVPSSAAQEKYGLMLASNEFPDMIFDAGTNTTSYPGGDEKGVDDGILRDLTPYVDKYMPNYRTLIAENDDVMRCVVTDEGNNIGAYMIRTYVDGKNQQAVVACEPCWCGPVIRKDWLDELKMEVPATVDELHEVLVAFKDNYNATMDLYNDGILGYDVILSAYGVTSDFYQENNQVKFGPSSDGYKQYVTLMNNWYNEGLINPDFIANSGWYLMTDNATFANNVVGFGMGLHGTAGRALYNNGTTDNENFYLEPMTAPVLNKGDKVNVMFQSLIAVQPLYVTTSVTDEEMPYLAQWIDYHYTYDYLILNAYGVEGESYTIDENSEWYYVFTDKIKYPENGMSNNDALGFYATTYSEGFMNWQTSWQLWELTGNDWSRKGYETWAKQTDDIMLPSNIAFTAEEAAEYSNIYVDIESYVQEMTVKFITGDKDINAEWDSYTSTIENMNVQRCIELKQAALDRFSSKTWKLAE